MEDGFESLSELQAKRDHHRNRIAELTLLRDRVTAGETYALRLADLRAADLMSPDSRVNTSEPEVLRVEPRSSVPIDGLKLTMAGDQLQQLLRERKGREWDSISSAL